MPLFCADFIDEQEDVILECSQNRLVVTWPTTQKVPSGSQLHTSTPINTLELRRKQWLLVTLCNQSESSAVLYIKGAVLVLCHVIHSDLCQLSVA